MPTITIIVINSLQLYTIIVVVVYRTRVACFRFNRPAGVIVAADGHHSAAFDDTDDDDDDANRAYHMGAIGRGRNRKRDGRRIGAGRGSRTILRTPRTRRTCGPRGCLDGNAYARQRCRQTTVRCAAELVAACCCSCTRATRFRVHAALHNVARPPEHVCRRRRVHDRRRSGYRELVNILLLLYRTRGAAMLLL